MTAIAGLLVAMHTAHANQGEPRPVAHVEGATLRLVLSRPDGAGRVDGVLAIDLEPGWKTYWVDPGPVGLAPHVDFSASRNLSDPRVDFPPPVRFREGEQTSVGYAAPVLVPFSLQAEAQGDLRADLTLRIGVCRELCVPVQERLSALPLDSLSVRAEILAARRLLPEPTDPDRVTLAFDGRTLRALIPGSTGSNPPDLFPVSAGPWRFDQPVDAPVRRENRWEFSFPTELDRTPNSATPPPIDLVLTEAEGARSLQGVPVALASPFTRSRSNEVRP